MGRVIGRTNELRGEFTGRRRLRTFAVLLLASVAASTACDSGRIVNTDDPRPTTQTTSTTEPPPAQRPETLVNAADFYAQPDGLTGYYFTSPSTRWTCAIIPRDRAGCQSSTGTRIAITGAPTSVPDAQGVTVAPTAIQVDRVADAQFVAIDPPGYSLVPGPAAVLPFGKVLVVAGFRCNVQESTGISCLSELTGRGFTFNSDGYTLQYTDLPA
jgi:hypothetical protein